MMTTVMQPATVTETALVERARRGDRDAFEQLYEEHAAAAWRLAMAMCGRPAVAGGAVIAAFGKVFASANRSTPEGQGPFRLQLLTATRNATIDGHRVEDAAPATGVGAPQNLAALARSETDAHPATRAFEQLPEGWRTVLWLTEVEGLDVAETANILGLSTQGAAQLASRAHAGLLGQFAQAQLRSASQPDCQRTAERLRGYVADTLSPRDTARVRRHLDGCVACRDRLDEVDDIPSDLRRSAVALPLVVFAAAEQAWAASLVRATGPLGLTLPGGQTVPPWAERALAGATAAVIALGITGAVIAGGSGSKDRDSQPSLAARTEQPIGAADSEISLGGSGGNPIGDGGAPAGQDARTPRVSGSPTVVASDLTAGAVTGEPTRGPARP